MKDNPPYSIAEIQVLLSQYLDGAMDAAKRVEMDALLEQFPEYKQEFLKLQATRNTVQQTPELHFTKISDQVWKNIARQMQVDEHAPLLEPDVEFISAYYDGEIPATDPAFYAFEAQLYRNDEANRILAGIGEISEAIRQFGYRLETTCTLDITEQVMAAYHAEQEAAESPHRQQEESQELHITASPLAEMMSAYSDQELSPRDTIEANRLIESDEHAKQLLGQFNRLSTHIQAISAQLQEQAPDLLPQVMEKYRAQPEDGTVVPLDRDRTHFHRALKIAIPTAAAAALLLLTLPVTQVNTGHLEGTTYSAKAKTDATQLATVPMSATGNGLMRVSSRSAAMDARLETRERDDASFSDAPLSPAETPHMTEQAAFAPDAVPASAEHKHKAPSSEEYLFNALSEQMPEEDISAILGN